MGKHDKLIAFLEHEAEFLRHRIADYKQVEFPPGVTTGDGEKPPVAELKEAAESKLHELENHIRELRWSP